MALTLLLRGMVASALGAALLARASPASAQFSFPSTSAAPGELSGGEVLVLMMAGLGGSAAMVYAGVTATLVDRPTKSNAPYVGFTIGGGVVGALGSVYLPWVDQGTPSFGYTFVTGLFYGMAGVGIGGLAGPKDLTAPWLGGSIGLGTAAVYRGVLSFAGEDDYVGGAAAQLTLGLLGTVGCGLDAIFVPGTERWVAVGCGGVSLLAAIHGGVMLGKPDRPQRAAPRRRAGVRAVPVPWFQKDAGGLALAGVF